MRRWNRGKKPPEGYELISPVIDALENELRDKVKESNENTRNTESMWPILQIQHQRTRYVYDMFHTYKKISRPVYDFCVKNKIADAALIAKWKKPGYERLCSTYVINPSNYKFGTVSICRVPLQDRNAEKRRAQDPTTGCFGCASGREMAPKNIFGNKYGQHLAAVQVAREKRMEAIEAKQLEEKRRRVEEEAGEETDGGSETDGGGDEDDYGPEPVAGVWAGTQKLEDESETLATDNAVEGSDARPAKKPRPS